MFEQWYYLLALCISLAGLAFIDKKYKLAFWRDARRSALTILTGVVVFLIWDIAGISLGVFFHGGSPFTLPFRLAPELPLEEVFFLTLLCYVTLLLFQAGERLWPRT